MADDGGQPKEEIKEKGSRAAGKKERMKERKERKEKEGKRNFFFIYFVRTIVYDFLNKIYFFFFSFFFFNFFF